MSGILGGKTPNFYNLSSAELIEHAIRRNEGILSKDGALITNTKKYTGRSPNDKFTVLDDITKDTVWFSDINKPMQKEHAAQLATRVKEYLAEHSHFVVDCFAGAEEKHALKLRVNTERAWHALFARNMFITKDLLTHKEPDFEIFHAPGFFADPKRDHTNSEACVLIDFSNRHIVICGTEYAGEIKKSVFTVLNFLLPNKNVLSMHCSANKNDKNEVAIFFGLSGTGKTTLSAEKTRSLIGDDEHGWDDSGVFNLEGGCYAKVIGLSKQDEPEIYDASLRFSSILENVVYDEQTRIPKFEDDKYTENTRSSYDISFIPKAALSGKGGHPKHIIMLTCDAFGVLPPLARLSPEAATYHFINGYTAKVAGTERGIKEPKAVFSACFGAPFMAHFPAVYAKIFQQKISDHKISCWLVNTGWTGGPFSMGYRMKISWTRTMLNAIFDGSLDKGEFIKDSTFNLMVPKKVDGVPQEILIPRNTWIDKDQYDQKAQELAGLFVKNFENYKNLLPNNIGNAGPTLIDS